MFTHRLWDGGHLKETILSAQQQRSTELNGSAGADLPDAELEVLSCVWQHGQATARQVREAMAGYRPMAHGSMVTLLRRLEAKGWLTRRKASRGKAFVYQPTRRPTATHRHILRKLVRRIFGGNGVKVVATLLDTAPPTSEELDRLQELIDEMRSKADRHESDR